MGVAYPTEAPICLNLRFGVGKVQMISGNCECILQTAVDSKHICNVCSLCYVAIAALGISLYNFEGSVMVSLAGCSENFLQGMESWECDPVRFAVLYDVVVKAGKVINIVSLLWFTQASLNPGGCHPSTLPRVESDPFLLFW